MLTTGAPPSRRETAPSAPVSAAASPGPGDCAAAGGELELAPPPAPPQRESTGQPASDPAMCSWSGRARIVISGRLTSAIARAGAHTATTTTRVLLREERSGSPGTRCPDRTCPRGRRGAGASPRRTRRAAIIGDFGHEVQRDAPGSPAHADLANAAQVKEPHSDAQRYSPSRRAASEPAREDMHAHLDGSIAELRRDGVVAAHVRLGLAHEGMDDEALVVEGLRARARGGASPS